MSTLRRRALGVREGVPGSKEDGGESGAFERQRDVRGPPRVGPGTFRFNLTGPKGNVIATSQPYASRASVLRGIELVRKHSANAEVVDQARTRVVGGGIKKDAPNNPRR